MRQQRIGNDYEIALKPVAAFIKKGVVMAQQRQYKVGTQLDKRVHQSSVIMLPPPQKDGGMPLLTALRLRRSTRDYIDRPIPLQALSDLLWAAFGINRSNGDRTAPYWRHVMVMDIYLVMEDGVWLYEPKMHQLQRCMLGDFRAATGLQEFVGIAALNLIYVAHGERMDVPPQERRLYAAADAGFIGQNVYLYCASEGLATVFRGALDYQRLGEILNLPDQAFVVFAQTVGCAKPH